MTGKRTICRVRGCRRTATGCCPIPGGELEIDVCGPCGTEIAADPSGWKVTALPGNPEKDLLVIVRAGEDA